MTCKSIVFRVLYFVSFPLRAFCRKRDGEMPTAQRKEIPNHVLLNMVSESLSQGHTAIIWVKGYSMRPFLEYGRDRVKLAPPDHPMVGDAVLAQISPGHYVLHRIIEISGESVVLQGDGNIKGTEHCRIKDICGKVVQYIRPKKVIMASDPAMVRCVRLWRFLRPVRRWLLLLYRLTV